MKKFIFLILFPTMVDAEPDETTQYLLNQPATLFDIGMSRLTQTLHYWEQRISSYYHRNAETGKNGGNVNSGYDPETDRFEVLYSTSDTTSDAEAMEKGCTAALGIMRLYVIKSMGNFETWGQPDSNRPKDFTEKLIKNFDFVCYVDGYDSAKPRFKASYSGREQEMQVHISSP